MWFVSFKIKNPICSSEQMIRLQKLINRLFTVHSLLSLLTARIVLRVVDDHAVENLHGEPCITQN